MHGHHVLDNVKSDQTFKGYFTIIKPSYSKLLPRLQKNEANFVIYQYIELFITDFLLFCILLKRNLNIFEYFLHTLQHSKSI